MPYTETMEKAPWSAHDVGGKENWDAIQQALQEGKTVQWRFSSFKDPGPDWSEVLIDGELLPGSRKEGY